MNNSHVHTSVWTCLIVIISLILTLKGDCEKMKVDNPHLVMQESSYHILKQFVGH